MKAIQPTIVLVRPQLPENIGLTARAMHNCGLNRLIIVSPKEKWPNQKAIDTAANAKVIFNKAKFFNSISEAISDYNLVIATSARKRFLRENKFFPLYDLKKFLYKTLHYRRFLFTRIH